ncbi:MAG: ComEC/Rec2 family competence protein [Anaerotruncus sp.]|nr:MAG: ComEC/Rec2 family competence protein [Anaerotruncus sp.]
MLTGDKSLLGNEAYTAFRLCGATHLMAVSGLHMSILFGMLYSLLKKLLVPKVPRVSVCAVGIFVFYIMLSGFSKSMIRCGIMMLVFLLGKLVKKKNDSLNSLGFAAFIVCLNPYAVADAGVQLTFTAVLGLITVAPHIQKKIKIKNKVFSYFAGILCASLAVTATTLPSMYFLFGFVSFAGIASNLLLIPLATVFARAFRFVCNSFFCACICMAFSAIFAGLFRTPCLSSPICFSRGTIAGITVGGQKLAAAICSIFFFSSAPRS